MNRRFRQTLLFHLLGQIACVSLDRPITDLSDVIRGNTKKDIVGYGFEEKSDYRKFLYKKKIEEDDREKEIRAVMEKEKNTLPVIKGHLK